VWTVTCFSGRPDWNKLLAVPRPRVTPRSSPFDNETEQLCAMVNDWRHPDLSGTCRRRPWQFIKDKGFLG